MHGFQEIFEEYGGDYSATMSRLMNNQTLYLKLLNMLFADDSHAQLESALDNGDLEAGFRAVHTLKGIVGNLGLTPLHEACAAIVEPLRSGDADAPYPALLADLRDAFARTAVLRADLTAALE